MRGSQGQVASRGGSGGADRGKGALRTPACRQECPDGGAVECQGWSGWRGGAGGYMACWLRLAKAITGVRRDAAARAHVRAKRMLWVRPEHARDVFDEMPVHDRGRG